MRENLFEIIQTHSKEYSNWIEERADKLSQGFVERDFYLMFSMASRAKGGDIIFSDKTELSDGDMITMHDWQISRLGRVYLLLTLAEEVAENQLEKIYRQLLETAELKELVALYSALPFLPDPEIYVERAAEGVRSNISPVFEAVTLNNPYPAKHLPDVLWNQLVLKAVFTEKPLFKITGLDSRANPDLSVMLINYAKERWAAGRYVTPELWRPVAPFLRREDESLLMKMLEENDVLQHQAAILAMSESSLIKAQKMSEKYLSIVEKINNKELTWNSLGEAYENKNTKI